VVKTRQEDQNNPKAARSNGEQFGFWGYENAIQDVLKHFFGI